MKTRLAILLATLASLWLTATRLEISSDLSGLFPNRGEAAALARFARVFGGGDLAVLLVRGDSAAEVLAASQELAVALRTKPSVARVLDRAPAGGAPDPTLAWEYAGPGARVLLERALTPDGMRARLEGTRDLLLAPGSSDAETWLARDPLRLAQIPWESKADLAAGVGASADGAFVADDGRARLVIVGPKGSAFESRAAGAFVADAESAMAPVLRGHPGVAIDLTGGHAIAHATEAMLKRDLVVSGTLSLVLASLVFVATFRRGRALIAVLPPLAIGTLWTTGLAALAPSGLSAIAIAFTAVVVGVGVDTGVHVYAALLEGRRRGLAPADAALFARRETWRPTLLAALAAGLAFGSLALSELSALRQLGILCGVGEVLTAIAILLLTPEIGALLERAPPPPVKAPPWLSFVAALTATRARAKWALAIAALPIAALFVVGWPKTSDALVAIRPRALAPLVTQEAIYKLFGGRPGQWLVMSVDRDPERAAARSDAIAEALDPLARDGTIDGFDALANYAPSPPTARARLAARDALDLPKRRGALEAALVEAGFDVEACAPALDAFLHPSTNVAPLDTSATGPLAWLVARHLASDGGDTIAVTYVRARGDEGKDARALAAIAAADPTAVVTGYPHLERALRATLAHDLPRVAFVALLVVAVALRALLGRTRDVLLALATIVIELAAVALVMRALALRWHVYDALVLPVLIGVTIDESMFLLHAAREGGATRALRDQGPLVASTALTTAAGFLALLACRFDGLFDLGAVGALGVTLGLVSALVVVPAGLRLGTRTPDP